MLNIIITFCLLGNLFSAIDDSAKNSIDYSANNYGHAIIFYNEKGNRYRTVQTKECEAGTSTLESLLAHGHRENIFTTPRKAFQSQALNVAFRQLEAILEYYPVQAPKAQGEILRVSDIRRIRTEPRKWEIMRNITLKTGNGDVFVAFEKVPDKLRSSLPPQEDSEENEQEEAQ